MESEIQRKTVNRLILEGWYCIKTHGNALQSGFPDIFAAHKRYGTRWIEFKRPKGSSFTQAQLNVFTKFASKNIGVWVLTGPEETSKLMYPANWYTHLHKSRGIKFTEIVRRPRTGPEGMIQNHLVDSLSSKCGCPNSDVCSTHKLNNWFCLETYGNAYQSGFPDVLALHKHYGSKWIECKNPAGYKFTEAQMDVFPRFAAEGVGIWIVDGTAYENLNRIHYPANWHMYLWGVR